MRTIVSWSSGKDSAWALHRLQGTAGVEVVGLMTTLDKQRQRVGMHGTRRRLVEAQAAAVGLPVEILEIDFPAPNDVYDRLMLGFVERALAGGVEAIAFGDLYLEDIRAYRESRLAGTGLRPLFPLWGSDTRELALEMIEGGLDARLIAIDLKQVPRRFAGARFDRELLSALPAGIDPCAERGEFHTAVVDGPMFSAPLDVVVGSIEERDGFVYADLASRL
ncbi:MAG: ATP-binding protein [Hyphomicrobiaceae bacterium]